jgi:hypothetical protein
MFLLVLSILIPIAAGIGAFILVKTKIASSSSNELIVLTQQLESKDKELHDLLHNSSGLWSRKQLESIINTTSEIKKQILSNKSEISNTEAKLSTAQVQVDEKEKNHQGLKVAKQEDLDSLNKISTDGPGLAERASALEKELAQYYKTLEGKMNDPTLNPLVKELVGELFNCVSVAADRIRGLIIEQKSLTDRILSLQEQQAELEGEYTMLVEKNLSA